ncbi:MAG: methyltransferase domain-containing protein [Desulfarculaceae bacterium]|nr:methyltransferase domain-containing protein [Desulfarculaceae bacterium]
MSKREWKAEDFMRLASGYWPTAALHAGVQTGLLPELSRGPATAEELAARLGLDADATQRLAGSLAALGVLSAEGDTFRLHPDLVPFLDPDGPRSLVNYAHHMADMMATWAQLADCVRTGKPVEREELPDSKESPGRTHFYLAMRDIARGQAPGLAERLGLKAGQSLLDLGGGPGVYAHTFAEETPGLQAAVFDLPGARQAFDEEASRHPHGGEVGFITGDYRQDPLGGPYDVIWISQVLHGDGYDNCQALIDKAAAALKSGGVLWVQEFYVGPEGPKHPWPALFSLNMLLNTPEGRSYTVAEVCGFMEQAGLIACEYAGPTKEGSPAALVKGIKP